MTTFTPAQRNAAAYGRQLFDTLAGEYGVSDDAQITTTAGPAGSVVVARAAKGGGRIYVAEDRSVLYVASHVSTAEADAAFLAGVRTRIEQFTPPLTD